VVYFSGATYPIAFTEKSMTMVENTAAHKLLQQLSLR